ARARPREAAALELEDLRQAVDCGDLDEPAVDPQLAEEDDAPRLTRGERPKHATDGAVFAPVRPFLQRQSEAIDARPWRSACCRARRLRPTTATTIAKASATPLTTSAGRSGRARSLAAETRS